MAETFRLQRAGEVDLVFEGECLTFQSSQESERQTHWTEIRIYRTTTGKYVAETIGRTTISGQHDRRTVRVVEDPADLREALRIRNAWYLTDLALDALADAGRKDEKIAAATPEKI